MRAVVQRVSRAKVTVDGEITGEIGRGFLVLLGVADGDTEEDVRYLAQKTAGLRVFEDVEGK
jgi:D-tyrosyl-tRNA(Tyr) deacylase